MILGYGNEHRKLDQLRKKNLYRTFLLTIADEKNESLANTIGEDHLSTEKKTDYKTIESTEICQEIVDHKKKEFLEKKRRQYLRTNNATLIELQTNLRAAYIAYSVAIQKKQIEEQKKEKLRLEAEELKSLQAQQDLETEQENKNALEEKKKQALLGEALRKQMLEKSEMKMKEYEEKVKAREAEKKFAEVLKNEKKIELINANIKKAHLREETMDMIKQKEIRKRTEPKYNIEEFLKCQKKKDEMDKKLLQAKAEKLKRQQDMAAELGIYVQQEAEGKLRRQDLITSLLIEERRAREQIRFKEEIEARRKLQEILRQSYQQSQYETKKNVEREEELNTKSAAIYKTIYDKYDEELLRRQQLSQQKDAENKRALREATEQARRDRAAMVKEKLMLDDYFHKEELKKLKEVEAEKLFMLKQFPPEILRYLPKGTVEEKDWSFLGITPKK